MSSSEVNKPVTATVKDMHCISSTNNFFLIFAVLMGIGIDLLLETTDTLWCLIKKLKRRIG